MGMSFFKDSFNHLFAFKAVNSDVNAFIKFINEQCSLNLTPSNTTCEDPEQLVLGTIKACQPSAAWLKEFAIYTCNQLGDFSDALLDCIENSAKTYFNAQEECPSHSHTVGWVLGGLALASVSCACIGYAVYKYRQAEPEKNETVRLV